MPDVFVMGAGAIGAYYGACLARAGHRVVFCARGANLEALRTSGVRVTGAMGDFELDDIETAEHPEGRFDLVMLCVKNYHLAEVCAQLDGIGDDVLTLQNGVDAPRVASEVLGPDVVLAGSTGIVCDLPEPGHVHLTSAYAWVRFGEPDGSGITDRVQRVHEWLDVDGVESIPAPDARVALWDKMALMCGMAGLTTLYQRPMGELLADPATRAEFEAVVRECESVARAQGVPLGPDFFDKRMHYADGVAPDAMSSMSRDFARGRQIEIETFNGAIVRMGAELGIEVPANRAVYDGIAAKR